MGRAVWGAAARRLVDCGRPNGRLTFDGDLLRLGANMAASHGVQGTHGYSPQLKHTGHICVTLLFIALPEALPGCI